MTPLTSGTEFATTQGTPVQNQYGAFGVANKVMWVLPGSVRGILLGEFNTGKTSFLGSNPAALIINLDLSSTPSATTSRKGLPAQMWPVLDNRGIPCDYDGKPISLDLAALNVMKDRLIKASKANQPRPETIVIDSATEWLNILRRATLIHFNKATWDEGRGDAMWEWLYSQINSFLNDLRDAGYGVWVIAHISPEYITTDDGKKKTNWVLNLPPGFMKRFYGSFETAVEIQKTYTVVEKEIVQDITIKGVTTQNKRKVNETVAVFTLVGENPERSSLLKRRVAFPSVIQLPAENGWQAFVDEYLKAARPS